MPTNLYGPGDYYHSENSHVIPAMIRRIHTAKENGDPKLLSGVQVSLAFLHVDDLAEGVPRYVLKDPPNWVNIGSGEDLSIGELARQVGATIGYEADLCTIPSNLTVYPVNSWTTTINFEKLVGHRLSVLLRV